MSSFGGCGCRLLQFRVPGLAGRGGGVGFHGFGVDGLMLPSRSVYRVKSLAAVQCSCFVFVCPEVSSLPPLVVMILQKEFLQNLEVDHYDSMQA